MNRIETKYLGLTLKSPVILSSSGLTSSLKNIKEAEAAGVGAVVLKSIFEEQIVHEINRVGAYSNYPEADDYVRTYVADNNLGTYLQLIEDAKQQCSIPIIASINCESDGEWINFTKAIQAAGADAIELNIFLLPTDKEMSSQQIEQRYIDIIARVNAAATIPVSVKLGQGFTNPLAIIREIYYRNVGGVVLFNRFYPTDIDIERMVVKSGDIFSSSTELSNVLRWISFVSADIPLIDIAASTGVHRGEDAVKAMLAGATAVEIASVVYEKGMDVVTQMNTFIRDWMDRHDFARTRDFIGRMNAANIANPTLYERVQFMRYYSGHE